MKTAVKSRVKTLLQVLAGIVAALGVMLALTVTAAAHVVVKPAEVLSGAYQVFTVSVPNERDVPYTKIVLNIPKGVASVTPTVKEGWKITTAKTGQGESATVTSITWQNGSVGGGLRDDFTFSAKVPDSTEQLTWKAYQTYSDGKMVSWDQGETGHDDDSADATSGPFSVTKVLDKTPEQAASDKNASDIKANKNTAQLALVLSVVALASTLLLLVVRPSRK